MDKKSRKELFHNAVTQSQTMQEMEMTLLMSIISKDRSSLVEKFQANDVI